MFNSHIHASVAQLQARGNAQAHQSSPRRIQNRSERGSRSFAVDANPKPARSFLSTAWRRFASFLPRMTSRATPNTTAACDRLLTPKTCEEISNGYFHALYRGECANDRNLSPQTFVAQQRNYAGEHALLRNEILQEPGFIEKFKTLPGTARFYFAEMEAHKRLLCANAYPPVFMSRIERVVGKLNDELIRSFGLSQSDIAAGQQTLGGNVAKLASDCFSKIREQIPRNMQRHIPPAARMIYCELFEDIHAKLSKAVPAARFSDQYVAVFAHTQAMNAIADKLPDTSGGARNPDGLPQRAIWMRNMKTVALEFLGFKDMKDEQSYKARISGADRILSKADNAVMLSAQRNALDNRRCEERSVRTMTAARLAKRAEFPVHLLHRENALNGIYQRLYRNFCKKLQANRPELDRPSNLWLTYALAHVAIDTMTIPDLPKEYLAWMKSVSDIRIATLADRLFIPSDVRNRFAVEARTFGRLPDSPFPLPALPQSRPAADNKAFRQRMRARIKTLGKAV